MSVIPPDVDEARLLEICQQRWAESQTLDFKRSLPAGTDRDKAELLKDVCAMANADGGDLVYGIDEIGGAADKLTAIAGEPADAAKRRLGQIIDAGVEPRIAGLHLQDIAVAGGYILIARVPASYDGPHCFKMNEARRFVMRNGTYIQDMNYAQLRIAFDRTATIAERARRFRDERAAMVGDTYLGKTVEAGPVCVVHLIPIASMARTQVVDIEKLYNNYTPFIFARWGGATRSTNLDGLIVYPPPRQGGAWIAYTQIFRSGAFEATRFTFRVPDPSKKIIPAVPMSAFVREALAMFLKATGSFAMSGPAIAGAAVFHAQGYTFGLPPRYFGSDEPADRNVMILPEVWVEEISAATVDDVARPLLDILWQSFGVERCYQYDEKGGWIIP